MVAWREEAHAENDPRNPAFASKSWEVLYKKLCEAIKEQDKQDEDNEEFKIDDDVLYAEV